MTQLIFLSNELCNPDWHRKMRIPLKFITFAYIKGKMFKGWMNQSTFVAHEKHHWGNDVVYGGIFLLEDFDYYITILDAYNACSMSTLGKNHKFDLHHRINTTATPISFSTIDEFSRLMYEELEEIDVQTYLGNPTHLKTTKRLNAKNISYRIVDGLDKKHFIRLTQEELQ